ncbi:copper oxidase [Longimicrobium sp.]|uniref:multicopper oxidase family protein n=1 Tax=Longimicrobium sp. TaxID=2029185 RepID=UPI002BF96AE5|nr:copper oxidase [Longimicrobium sp.]HSU16084.1 copper oxidase [Longimicrobium sp.]
MSDILDKTETRAPARPSRRDFLRGAAVAVAVPAVAGALAACNTGEAGRGAPKSAGTEPAGTPPGAVHPDSDHSGGTMAANPKGPATAAAAADEMDRHHEAGIKSFPAATKGKGNQPFAPRMENGVKVFDITAAKTMWEVAPGQTVEAWAYNGQVPGPQIRVKEGDRVRVNFTNNLDESSAIHFHGLAVPISMDGVPFITQPPVKPGGKFVYEFTVPNPGSHMYHSHLNSSRQVPMGLLGAFIVEPRGGETRRADVDHVMILNDGPHGYTLNGKGFPATEPIVASLGQKVRIRFMNEGMMIHPMHLHGMPMTVTHKDGYAQPQPWKCDTLNIAPGERWDVMIDCNNPGTWALHCHILPHAEGPMGMFGMVTALVVK